jgi:hypothetical protein
MYLQAEQHESFQHAVALEQDQPSIGAHQNGWFQSGSRTASSSIASSRPRVRAIQVGEAGKAQSAA